MQGRPEAVGCPKKEVGPPISQGADMVKRTGELVRPPAVYVSAIIGSMNRANPLRTSNHFV
jgi:hypothetical protein